MKQLAYFVMLCAIAGLLWLRSGPQERTGVWIEQVSEPAGATEIVLPRYDSELDCNVSNLQHHRQDVARCRRGI